MDKNSTIPKQKSTTTICEKLMFAIRSTAQFRTIRFISQQHHKDAVIASSSPSANVCLLTDRSARVSKQPVVPLQFDTTAQKRDPKTYAKPKVSANKAQEKATVLPIHGNESRIPSMAESGHTKSAAAENINRMFSEYITRTKHRFQSMPTFVETPSFREGSGAKERRLKK